MCEVLETLLRLEGDPAAPGLICYLVSIAKRSINISLLFAWAVLSHLIDRPHGVNTALAAPGPNNLSKPRGKKQRQIATYGFIVHINKQNMTARR